jgi:hypothetical protein
MPENVSVSERAMVIAGFAKDVDDVNQYAADPRGDHPRCILCAAMTDDDHEQTRVVATNSPR